MRSNLNHPKLNNNKRMYQRCGVIHSEEHVFQQNAILDMENIDTSKREIDLIYIVLPVQDMKKVSEARIRKTHQVLQTFYNDLCHFNLLSIHQHEPQKDYYHSFDDMIEKAQSTTDLSIEDHFCIFITRHRDHVLGTCNHVPGRNVMVDDRTLCDGEFEYYHDGMTLVHQMGHALGLSHPFAYQSCHAPLADLGLPKAKHPNYYHEDNNKRDYLYYCKDMKVEEICKDGGCNGKTGPPWGCFYKSKNDCGAKIPKEQKGYMMDFTQDSEVKASKIPEKAKHIIRYQLDHFHKARKKEEEKHVNMMWVWIVTASIIALGVGLFVYHYVRTRGTAGRVSEVFQEPILVRGS